MKQRFWTGWAAVFFCCLWLMPCAAMANETYTGQKRLNISTVDTRPMSVDRLLYTAFMDIGVLTTNTVAPSLRAGFDLAGAGERDAVTSAVPNMEEQYPHLRKIPVPINKVNVVAYANENNPFQIEKWSDLSGLRVGMLIGLVNVRAKVPADTEVVTYESVSSLAGGLVNGEYDVMLYSVHWYQVYTPPKQITQVNIIDTMTEYLYLHEKHEALIPAITQSLEQLFADGRGEKILSDTPMPERYMKKTILHIISSNNEVTREAQFGEKLRALMADDTTVEWYSLALNARSFSDERTRLNYFANLLRQDFVSRNVAAIVVSGDEALSFVVSNYDSLFYNTPVLFYGVTDNYASAIEGYEPFFTGVMEQIEAEETISVMLSLFPHTKQVFIVNDFTAEGWYYRLIMAKQLARYTHRIEVLENTDGDREELINQIMALPPDSLVLVGSYFRDASGQYFSLNDMKNLLARTCSVPIVSIYSTGPDYHAVGGKCPDYEQYAEVIYGMIRSVLAGGRPSDIPVVTDSVQYNRWVFDKLRLDEWKISESSLPAGALIVNREKTLWETNPQFMVSILMMLAIFAIVSLISLILVNSFREKNAALLAARESLHTAEEMLEVKDRLERIISTAPVSYMLLIDEKVVEINESMSRDTGLVVGSEVLPVFEGLAKKEIVPVRFADNEIHRCLVNITTTEYDQQSALIVWAVDMEKEEAQKDQMTVMHESLRTVLDLLPVPVRITDIETKQVIYINNQCMDMFGFKTREDAYRMKLYDMMPEKQENGMCSRELVDRLMNTLETLTVEFENLTVDGRIIDAQIITCQIKFNNRESLVGIIKDLAAEKAYKKMLVNAAEKEKEANQLKSRFLVNMSHEIRTPMNAIIGLTDIELRKNQSGKALEIFKKINVSARSLLQIINDILDLSKIESDKMELVDEEFELEELLNSSMLVAVPRLEGRRVEMLLDASLDLPRYLIGDRTRLWQILKNFLDNSAKFTEQGKIVLTVSIDPDQSSVETAVLTFVITDTGIGIAPERIPDIFIPYQQVQNELQKKYASTGLGMPISKQLCEMMGGEMQIDSQLGKGTVTRMTIPFKRSVNHETERQAVNTPELAGKSVLIVDDDDLERNVVINLLASNNMRCVTAANGAQALEAVRDYHEQGRSFDLIVMDYLMDGLDGLETTAGIRDGLTDVPELLMVTAQEKDSLHTVWESAGIGDVVEKPFIPSQFIHKINDILGIESKQPLSGPHDARGIFTQYVDAKVLLCEDNALNQEVATGMFAQFGIVPTIAENGRQALDIIKTRLAAGDRFDLIFMDLQMPGMSGFETTQAIRNETNHGPVPIVSLTADAMTEVIAQCYNAGMNDHITKPIEFNSLERVFRQWLPKRKQVSAATAEPASGVYPDDALARFGGNRALYEKALGMFFNSVSDDPWPDLAHFSANLEESIHCTHDIKGMSGNLSLTPVYEAAVAFEKTLRSGEPDLLLYNAMTDAIISAKNEWLRRQSGSSEPTLYSNTVPIGTTEELRAMLARLAVCLSEYDPTGCSEAADALMQKKWPGIEPDKINSLYQLTRNYAFFEALEALESLRTEIR